MQSRSGFTIVELLIAIVVIGILSAIVVVAFTGIQDRARNAKIVSALDIIEKAARLYALENGSYPKPSDLPGLSGTTNMFACVQPTSSGWVARDGLSSSQCAVAGGVQPNYYGYSAVLNAALLTQVSKIPDTSDITMNIGSGSLRGIIYQYVGDPDSVNTRGVVYLTYYIRNGQACGRGDKSASGTQTRCLLVLQ